MIRFAFCLAGIFWLFTACRPAAPPHDQGTPLERLKAGNARFSTGKPIHPDETLDRLRDLKKGQHPFAVVVSCSDSRVPPELIFDQGLGDIFSIRTAGNVIGDYELASIEYAVEHLGCKLVIVLGHQNCGAVDAYIHAGDSVQHNHIQKLIDYIRAEQEEKMLPDSLKHDIGYSVDANIRHGVTLLRESEPILKELSDKQEIRIIGALYLLENGRVVFGE